MATSPNPPLQLAWQSNVGLTTAALGSDVVYGITPDGKVKAISMADGSVRWQSSGTYLTDYLVVQGARLFAFRAQDGLVFLDDHGTTVQEQLQLGFAASTAANISGPVLDDRWYYLLVNQGLYASHQENGLQYGAQLSDVIPHGAALAGSRRVVTVDGKGVPTLYESGDSDFRVVWKGAPNGVDAGQFRRPFTVAGDRLVVAVGPDLVGYDLTTGQIAWHRYGLPVGALAAGDGSVYVAFHGAALAAIDPKSGAVRWQRQYLYDISITRDYELALAGAYLYFGATLQTNPDGVLTLAVKAADGSFAWLSRAAAGPWAGGFPLSASEHIFAYGPSGVGRYSNVAGDGPHVKPEHFEVTPRPLRGPAAEFGAGRISADLPVGAGVSITAYREGQGPGTKILSGATWGAGSHSVNWQPAASDGYTDTNQFGYLLIDVAETNGAKYTQALLLPVNTFPDVISHWAKGPIEAMLYHKYVSGYPDQLFRPDGLVTRAESSAIVAKTLGLDGPSPGFRTSFTDIAAHWARNAIMALEERKVVGGFAEPNGTFTFRPDLNMTRAQEARILVRAYSVPAAPANFVSRFTDIASHWAAADIKALEAAGYVNGFREPNGTYTYRPEQNLTRAELCTIVTRVRNITR